MSDELREWAKALIADDPDCVESGVLRALLEENETLRSGINRQLATAQDENTRLRERVAELERMDSLVRELLPGCSPTMHMADAATLLGRKIEKLEVANKALRECVAELEGLIRKVQVFAPSRRHFWTPANVPTGWQDRVRIALKKTADATPKDDAGRGR